MFGKIGKTIWKCTGADKSNVYFIDGEKKIMIDAGNRTDRATMTMMLGKAVDFAAIEVVIFTHLHYDHCGNFDMFPNAEFYASAQELADFKNSPNNTVLDRIVAEKLSSIEIKPLPEELYGLRVIPAPGHTRGSVMIWYDKEKALFTGDTYFGSKKQGRIDLPTSDPDRMKDSVMSVVNMNAKILCPGHDY
jgi:glyoxylase-like metal-dependent hydrolase (beta-lactamase superfamily II)